MNSETGKWMVVTGILLVMIGIIIWLFHDKLHWLGRLPGDIVIERENFRFYFPITTMILLSVLLSVIVGIFRKI